MGNLTMSKTNSVSKLSEEDVQCSICLYILVEPVRMPCNHCLCKECFQGVVKRTSLQCPVCRRRIGTFTRKAEKTGTLVDHKFWAEIKNQFREKLKKQKRESQEKLGDFVNIEQLSEPGEIMKEFQIQKMKMKDQSVLDQEAADEKMARELQESLSSSSMTRRSSSTPRVSSMGSPSTSTSFIQETPTSSNVVEDVLESDASIISETDSEGEDPKKSSRRLFKSLCNSSSEELGSDDFMRRIKKKKLGKENVDTPIIPGKRRQKKMVMKNETKLFPGCIMKPIIDGTSVLPLDDSLIQPPITIDATDGESYKGKDKKRKSKSSNKNEVTDKMKKQSTKSSTELENIKNTCDVSQDKNEKNIVDEVVKHNGQCDTEEKTIKNDKNKRRSKIYASKIVMKRSLDSQIKNVSNRLNNKGNEKSSSANNRNKSLDNSVASKCDKTSRESGKRKRKSGDPSNNVSTEDLTDVFKAILDDSVMDSATTSSLIAEQKLIAEKLKQESEDQKLALQLEKQFKKYKVDRTQGSGEEYGLRSSRRSQSKLTVNESRELSPAY